MKPLAVHGGAAEALFWACAAGWAIFELALALRTRGSGGRDRSFVPLTLSVLAGLAVVALGLALRAWAVHELGRFFKFTVVVQADHRVVDTGPYRLIRHPSY